MNSEQGYLIFDQADLYMCQGGKGQITVFTPNRTDAQIIDSLDDAWVIARHLNKHYPQFTCEVENLDTGEIFSV